MKIKNQCSNNLLACLENYKWQKKIRIIRRFPSIINKMIK